MHETRLKGNFIGGIINYGYSVVGNKVVLNEEEAPIVRQIFTDYANGKTVVDIAKDLRARGIRNRGRIFQDHTIYVLLRREKYTGIYRINGVTYNNIYPRIVPQEIFDAVRRKAEKLKHGKHVDNVTYLLRDNVICANGQHKILKAAELNVDQSRNPISDYGFPINLFFIINFTINICFYLQ